MAETFSQKAEEAPAITQKDVEKLHAKNGQLMVERVFFVVSPESYSRDWGKKQ